MLRSLPMLVLTGCCCCPFGGGGGGGLGDLIEERVAEEAAEQILERALGADEVEVDDERGTVRIATDDGDLSIDLGGTAEYPADFPVPQYPGSSFLGTMSTSMDGRGEQVVTLQTTDSIDAVDAHYATALAAFGEVQTTRMDSADGAMHTFMVEPQDGARLTVAIIASPGEPITIGITSISGE